jgi:hypothetical protein
MVTAVTFRAVDHTYITPAGRVLGGITGLLKNVGCLYEIEEMPLLDPSKGNRIHEAIDMFLRNVDTPENLLPIEERGFLLAVMKATSELGLDIQGTEMPVGNEAMGYATKVDALAKWRGKLACINWKTSIKVYRFYAIQSALEALCFSPDPVERLGIHLQADGKYRVQHYTDRNDFVVAKAAVAVAAWKKG